MRALTYHAPADLRIDTVEDPVIQAPTDAIVAVKLAAICGSDLHVWHGRERGLDPGTVMGHEFVGEVVDIGAAVTGIRRGDRVVSPFTTNCGVCFFCSNGLSARCVQGQLFGWVERGAGLQGGQAELVRVPLADSTLVPAPAAMPDEVAILLGDVLSTGYHCAVLGGVGGDTVVVVIGCGPVGLMAALAARELGAARVFAIDTVPARLALAGAMGAEALPVGSETATELLRVATGGRGADAVLEAVGSPDSSRLAFDLVRPGGVIAAVGVHHEAAFAFSPGQAYDKNLTYRIGRCPARHYMERLVPLAERRQDELRALFTHRVPLAEAAAAYRMFDAKTDGCIKVALTPGS